MKAYIKVTSLIIVLLLIVSVVVSCGNKSDDIPNDTTNTTESPEDNSSSDGTHNDDSTSDGIQDGNGGGTSTENDDSNKLYRVDFCLNDGTPIKSYTNVSKGISIIPPEAPYIPGKIFTGWSESTGNIQKDCIITAAYEDISDRKNVISTNTEYISNNSIAEMILGIYGDVCFCGIDIKITYDISKLTFEGFYAEDAMVVTNVDTTTGVIYLNYVSTENTVGEIDLCGLKFKSILDEQIIEPHIEITSIYYIDNQDKLSKPIYNTIPGKIIVLKEN